MSAHLTPTMLRADEWFALDNNERRMFLLFVAEALE